jgi:hypothetical protein
LDLLAVCGTFCLVHIGTFWLVHIVGVVMRVIWVISISLLLLFLLVVMLLFLLRLLAHLSVSRDQGALGPGGFDVEIFSFDVSLLL